MKKAGRAKKKSLRTRMGRRARAKQARLQQEAAARRRQEKISKGWVPPSQDEIDERIANRQCDAQDRVAAAEQRRKDRQRRKEVEAEKQKTITARLGEWMEGLRRKRQGKEPTDAVGE